MRIERQLISPAVAEEMLKKNTSNRLLKKHYAQRYANDMMDGKWMSDTAETIKVAKDGTILDGQHRLYAVTLAKIPVYMHVAYDVDESVMDYIDTGKPRNTADVFHIHQIRNANQVPSIIAHYNAYKDGYSGVYASGGRVNATNARILDDYYARPVYWQEVTKKTVAWYKAFARIIPPSIIGGMYCIFSDIDQEEADMFFDQFALGYDVQNITIINLRNTLIKDKTSLKKMPQSQKIALIIKSWNAFRRGKELKVLKFNPSVEEYPKPI